MTDKQIIIDGCDVRGCKNFSCSICEEENKIPRTINHFTADCRMYPNCYYKQLKRKEQECEELKKEINGNKAIIEKIRQEVQEDITCESRECGCDDYGECIECLKNTILNIIDE